MIREPSFLKKKKLSQLPPWMECWGKLLCWVSLFCKKFIIDLMFCWTTLKKKKPAQFIVPWKTGFVFQRLLHGQLWHCTRPTCNRPLRPRHVPGHRAAPRALREGLCHFPRHMPWSLLDGQCQVSCRRGQGEAGPGGQDSAEGGGGFLSWMERRGILVGCESWRVHGKKALLEIPLTIFNIN